MYVYVCVYECVCRGKRVSGDQCNYFFSSVDNILETVEQNNRQFVPLRHFYMLYSKPASAITLMSGNVL